MHEGMCDVEGLLENTFMFETLGINKDVVRQDAWNGFHNFHDTDPWFQQK